MDPPNYNNFIKKVFLINSILCINLQRSPPQLEMILKMISDTTNELTVVDKIIYKYSSQVSNNSLIKNIVFF